MVKVVLVLVVLVEVVVLVVVALVSSLLRNNVETGGGPQLLDVDSMNGIENEDFILIVAFFFITMYIYILYQWCNTILFVVVVFWN